MEEAIIKRKKHNLRDFRQFERNLMKGLFDHLKKINSKNKSIVVLKMLNKTFFKP